MGILITQDQERVKCILSRCEALCATITAGLSQLEVFQGQLQTGTPAAEVAEIDINLRMSLEVVRMSFQCLLSIERQLQARVVNCLTMLDLAGY